MSSPLYMLITLFTFLTNIFIDDLKLIYMMCAFETAWKKTVKSPWCDVLTSDAVEVMFGDRLITMVIKYA